VTEMSHSIFMTGSSRDRDVLVSLCDTSYRDRDVSVSLCEGELSRQSCLSLSLCLAISHNRSRFRLFSCGY